MKNLSLRLEQARKNAHLTRDEVVQLAAHTSGFSRSSLQDWEQEDNTREPKIEYLFDLARIYNVHPWTLLSGESLAQINTVDALAINSLNLLNNANQPINLDFPLPKWWLDGRDLEISQLVGYVYKGDTMSPTIASDAIVVVNKSENQLIDGGIYALLINSELFIRRVQRLPNGLRLISDNSKYPLFDIPQTKIDENGYFSVIGQVIFIGNDFKTV